MAEIKYKEVVMNLLKQYKKLATLNVEAEQCTTREEAKKILKKAKKVNHKVGFDRWKSTK